MTPQRPRRRRDQRDPAPPPMRLTDRDKSIIAMVYACRVLRQDQLQTLFFGSQTAAQRRLALLFHHGYLARQFLPVRGGMMNSPTLYLLDKRGEELLRAGLGVDDLQWKSSHNRVSHDFLEHTLAINDVRIALTLACRQPDFTMIEWHSETQIKQSYDTVKLTGRSRPVAVVPDSYFALETPRGNAHFLLELDRGTMTTKRFRSKVEAYIEYVRSGGYERRYGTRSLRVLTVTLSEARLINLKAVTEDAGGGPWFYFAVLPQLTPETVLSASVWRVAGQESAETLVKPM